MAASPTVLKNENDFHNEPPHELTIPEIEVIIDKFASAAVRAQKAGFDGVDINAASSHLLHNFLSPFWNRRKDAYGGSPENRARIVTSIIKEIKKRLGQDFPVSVCINSIEIGRAADIADEKCLTVDDATADGATTTGSRRQRHPRAQSLAGVSRGGLPAGPAFLSGSSHPPEIYPQRIRRKA